MFSVDLILNVLLVILIVVWLGDFCWLFRFVILFVIGLICGLPFSLWLLLVWYVDLLIVFTVVVILFRLPSCVLGCFDLVGLLDWFEVGLLLFWFVLFCFCLCLDLNFVGFDGCCLFCLFCLFALDLFWLLVLWCFVWCVDVWFCFGCFELRLVILVFGDFGCCVRLFCFICWVCVDVLIVCV